MNVIIYSNLFKSYEISNILSLTNENKDLSKYGSVPPKPPPNYNWVLQFIPGAVSGPVSRTITCPLDRLRLQMQLNPKRQTLSESWKSLMKNGGVLGLWRGNSINVTKVAPEMALRFGIYERLKHLFFPNDQPLILRQRLTAAASAGILTQCCVYPLELLKTRLMIRTPGEFSGVINAIVKIYRNGGVISFYRGFATSVVGIVPYTGVDLATYETLKQRLNIDKSAPSWQVIICGCISVTAGQLCAYPFYLVKARQQAESKYKSINSNEPRSICKWCKIILQIYNSEGFSGLYRGLVPTLSKVLPAGAINYVIYEHVRQYINIATKR